MTRNQAGQLVQCSLGLGRDYRAFGIIGGWSVRFKDISRFRGVWLKKQEL